MNGTRYLTGMVVLGLAAGCQMNDAVSTEENVEALTAADVSVRNLGPHFTAANIIDIARTDDGGYAALAFNSDVGAMSLFKFGAAHDLQWQRDLKAVPKSGLRGDNIPVGLVQTPDGGYLIVATVRADHLDGGSAGSGVWLGKLSRNGDSEWAKLIRGKGGDPANGPRPVTLAAVSIARVSSFYTADVNYAVLAQRTEGDRSAAVLFKIDALGNILGFPYAYSDEHGVMPSRLRHIPTLGLVVLGNVPSDAQGGRTDAWVLRAEDDGRPISEVIYQAKYHGNQVSLRPRDIAAADGARVASSLLLVANSLEPFSAAREGHSVIANLERLPGPDGATGKVTWFKAFANNNDAGRPANVRVIAELNSVSSQYVTDEASFRPQGTPMFAVAGGLRRDWEVPGPPDRGGTILYHTIRPWLLLVDEAGTVSWEKRYSSGSFSSVSWSPYSNTQVIAAGSDYNSPETGGTNQARVAVSKVQSKSGTAGCSDVPNTATGDYAIEKTERAPTSWVTSLQSDSWGIESTAAVINVEQLCTGPSSVVPDGSESFEE